jgi:putative redox protein
MRKSRYNGDMVAIEVRSVSATKCELTHAEGHVLHTDAPKDIGGDASAFSPTDLVAAGLAACILTTLGMWAARQGLDISGATAHVEKEMNLSPRRIGKLPVIVTISATAIPEEMRERAEKIAHGCPVHASLHPEIDAPITLNYL